MQEIPLSSSLFGKFQEAVFQILFALDCGGGDESDFVDLMTKQLSVTRTFVQEAYKKAVVIFDMKSDLDKKIAQISQNYDLNRIPSVEKNVLRFFFYRISYEPTFPHGLIIKEALRLARKFSTRESASFVNAILDSEKHEDDRKSI